ncbi:DUF2202 domain-containing protein [Maribacter polysaccharolyticus]|uniref:DUF2202 domain-containing protein n=1 Tax=Maribacter polysaccharolyticus TaxID=3020831 RepID=UPI00237F1E2A|nr:DUF2202 domain-containing protein [Maribacter polysaccharolyticus]MDE3740883.1 DUF2202 domain-containing protein [Maribacter polysaccharolyticus]
MGKFKIGALVVVVLGLCFSCSDDESDGTTDEVVVGTLLDEDEKALLFMLEEEKMARDTYDYLGGLYGITQFSSIKLSEQSHMDAVADLLDWYGIDYTLRAYGEFENEELQGLYDQLIEKGEIDAINALQVGATIEDLDIVDLQEFIDVTTNTNVIAVFENLQCGSRNHLRSFVGALESANGSYEPLFLTLEAYTAIIEAANEQCGQ